MKKKPTDTQAYESLPLQRFQKEHSNGGTATFEDNRPGTVVQRELQQTMRTATSLQPNPIPQKANLTGLPDNLKSGIENLSGYNMDDVKVHYNSSKPAQLQAHAYAQGTDIHLAPGQQKHLPHEAWHVVQQKQGRVKPTMQLKGKVNVNDDAGLEREADVMGSKARNITDKRPLTTPVFGEKLNIVPETRQGTVMRKSSDVIQAFSYSGIQRRNSRIDLARNSIFHSTGKVTENDPILDYIDRTVNRWGWSLIKSTPLKTAMNPRVLKILRKATYNFYMSYTRESFPLADEETIKAINEPYRTKKTFGTVGACETISQLWSYIINKIERYNISRPHDLIPLNGFHTVVHITGYGEVDASYRQFSYSDAEDQEEINRMNRIERLPMAISAQSQGLTNNQFPRDTPGYKQMTQGMLN